LTASEQLFTSALHTTGKTINRVYTYDDIYRLTGESLSINNQPAALNYGYDPVGNRLARTGTMLPSQSFTFDANDRLNTDSYDANGNTLLGLGFGQSQSDQYDFENLLTIRHTPTATITLKYDGDGNRVSKTVTTATNAVTTLYLVDELNPSGYAQVLEELTSVNAGQPVLTAAYAYGHNLISQTRFTPNSHLPTAISYYGYDGHNNVRYLTDANGVLTDTYDYDANGNLIAATGSTENYYLFTGEQFDMDLGLYYLRARYHNPDTGRFWNMDSFEGNGSDPASLHKYTYCQNNSPNAHDLSGHDTTLGESMIGQAVSNMMQGALISAFLGAWGRLWTGVGAGNDLSDIAQSTLDPYAISNDFESGAFWGMAGFGAGKALGYLIAKSTPFLIEWMPNLSTIIKSGVSATARWVTDKCIAAGLTESGEIGEAILFGRLQLKGYTDIMPIQNASGHGIDLVAKNLAGEWRYFEVKSTTTGLPYALRGQQKNIVAFVRSRLQRAAGGRGLWKNVAPEIRGRANQLLKEIDSGVSDIKGFKVDVFLPQQGGISLFDGPVQMDFTPW
jgi:RHS repeat-associated protein